MTLSEAMKFIQTNNWISCKTNLECITNLMQQLGDPQKELRFVHIAGTNGKGSTSAMLASILKEAGYKVGLFTSPHLQFYNERIKVNGKDISDDDFCAMTEKVKSAVEKTNMIPSEFERLTTIAFLYFWMQKCDIVILEVGLGGRLDSTNVIPSPEVAVITNIGLDHTECLGNTVEAIAAEKSGIIKPGTDVVLYGQSKEVESVVAEKCTACGNTLWVTDGSQMKRHSGNLEGQWFDYRRRKNLYLRLLGTYQCNNAAVVLDVIDVLCRQGWKVPEEAIRQGLSSVSWPGRFEALQTEPLVLVDGAHNPNGVEELFQCLQTYLPNQKIIFVMGVMADKGYGEMLDIIIPFAKKFITVEPDSCRALDAVHLKGAVESRTDIPVEALPSVQAGIEQALHEATAEDVICIFGSLYQVGEALTYFN